MERWRFRRTLTWLVVITMSMVLTAQERDRSKVPDALKWNLADVYADRGGTLISGIVNSAQSLGLELRDVHIAEPSLETLFLHHTGRSLRE